ncbi:aromatic amino acid lyase [Hymenobacter qilianensis]|uniref:aromatic amino acid lyase n=1 Tax=Hymenobacter qilianensis TaxID=1385715 RepID=UPI00293BFB53|nr:aromatic amino acid lyase [Hymenobacter qilianensis]
MYSLDPATHLSLATLEHLLRERPKVVLSDQARHRVATCYEYLRNRLEQSDAPIYGINTGFGALCNTGIAPSSAASSS